MKEAVSLQELALEDAKVNESVLSNQICFSKRKARVCDEVNHKEQCHISCGADVAVRNAMSFLWPR